MRRVSVVSQIIMNDSSIQICFKNGKPHESLRIVFSLTINTKSAARTSHETDLINFPLCFSSIITSFKGKYSTTSSHIDALTETHTPEQFIDSDIQNIAASKQNDFRIIKKHTFTLNLFCRSLKIYIANIHMRNRCYQKCKLNASKKQHE